MAGLSRKASGAAILAILIGAATGAAKSSRAVPERNAGTAAAGPQLHVSTESRIFHTGEVIPLELSFTSATPKRYLINMARYDRSGRMNYEQFTVNPADGTSDPLKLYFGSILGYLGGGLTGFQYLSPSPTIIQLNLNEWVSFDKPGRYELTVTSRRVSDIQTSQNPYGRPLELKSNAIELVISCPDAAWQQKQLTEIIASLDRAGHPGDQFPPGPYWKALAALRFLGSKGAARELARRLRGDSVNADFECMFGLIGSPNRAAGLEEMNKLLEDPAFPVSVMFLDTMAMLPLDPAAPPGTLRRQRDENLTALRQRLAGAIQNKQGKALAVSLSTVMRGTKLSPELQSQLVPKLIQVFSQLSLEQQNEWLQYGWNQIKDPEWLPVLRATALHYEDFPELRATPAYQSLQVSGEALLRWYQMDPRSARDAVIAEITRPKPRYDARVLGILPDKTLPNVEHVIAEHLLAADNYEIEGNLASLIFRYADRAVLPEVLREFKKKEGNWAGDALYQLLAYLLKVDPQAARPLLEREAAVRCPPGSECSYTILTTLGGLQNSPILESLALKTLWDPDPSAAIDAVNYLREYGSPKAEQSLWNRYEAWRREWKGRAAELSYVPMEKNPHLWDANLGQSLAHALATGSSWFSDENELRRIEALGVGANIQGDTEQALQASSRQPLTITNIGSSPPRFNIAQYEDLSLEFLMKKLTQYPSGTKFVFPPSTPTPSPEELKAREEIFLFAAKNGITVMCAR